MRYPVLRIDAQVKTRSYQTVAELLVGEIPKGELLHPNGFCIVATFFEPVILRHFGPMTAWVNTYTRTQQPYWRVATCISGNFHNVAKELGLDSINQTRKDRRDQYYLNSPQEDRLAAAFSFVPISLEALIYGYP